MRSNWEVPGHCAPSERSPSDIPEKSLAQVSPKKHGLRHTSMLDSGTCEVAVTFPKHGTGITYSHPRSTNHHHEWMVFVDRSLGLTSIRSGTCWMLVSLWCYAPLRCSNLRMGHLGGRSNAEVTKWFNQVKHSQTTSDSQTAQYGLFLMGSFLESYWIQLVVMWAPIG